MQERAFAVVGLGEILWDLLPGGRQLGGAPANFAYITTLLGDRGIVASRVGNDALGSAALEQLAKIGVRSEFVQHDPDHPTGMGRVEVDSTGQPCFEIAENVAWDFLEWTPEWNRLASEADAVCFGSLAQRCPASHATIRSFVRSVRPGAMRIFDVNLRQSFYSQEVLRESMDLADIVKLNHEELPRVTDTLGLGAGDLCSAAKGLLAHHKLKMVCVTRGHAGSVLVTADRASEHKGFAVKVADTVGSGDAFTAGLVHAYLRGRSLDEMNETANRIGAWVATRVGATPDPSPGGMREVLSSLT